MANFTHDYLRPTLNAEGLSDTKIIYCEAAWWQPAVEWMDKTLKYKPELVDDDIVAAGHGYSTVTASIQPMKSAEDKGIHVWQTET